MALFDVWTKNYTKVTVVKVKTAKESNVDGSTYLTTINSSVKALALKQAQAQLDSGILKEPTIIYANDNKKKFNEKEKEPKLTKPEIEKKAIYCDFNGVLDDKKRKSKSDSPAFRLPEISCPHKVYLLAQLAVKYNADLVFTSLHRLHGGDLECIIYRSLMNSENPVHVAFIEENKDVIQELTWGVSTPNLKNRSNEVKEHIISHKYSHYIVFEDEEYIDKDFNPIMTDTYTGLNESHIEIAEKILSKPF